MSVTRITVRATGVQPWAINKVVELRAKIEACLQRQLAYGEFDLTFEGDARKRQVVTDLDVFVGPLTAPRNGAQAKAEGFLRDENPFREGTAAHARWERFYSATD